MKPRILIVNDDQTSTRQLFWSLAGDYDVIVANDLQTAIRRATIYQPDVSVLDLQLTSEKDAKSVGLRLLKFIKEHFPESKILVVAQPRASRQDYEADGYLSTPVDLEQVLATLRRIAPPQLEVF
ncbi:MAG TPA: response regulator [Pyrinomonadaceae bacterium]|nr:response regulator [Pyrinomonadaceae bacterium]